MKLQNLNDVRFLTNENEKEFVEYMKSQYFHDKCLRKDWFDINLPYSLIHRYKNYLGWTLLYENNQIVAFAGIQEFKYLNNSVRVCTRMYYDPKIRHDYRYSTKDSVITPVTPFLINQFNFLKDKNYNKAILTIERHRHPNFVKMMAKNFNIKTNGVTNFLAMKSRIQTHDYQDEGDYQWYMEHNFK
jgi:hypothetical protein